MALYKIKDFQGRFQSHLDINDIIGLPVYANQEKVGSVDDLLVDDLGQFRYLVISTGLWFFGKKVLLPIAYAQIDERDRAVFAEALTKEQVEALPEFNEDMTVDLDYEERVNIVYRSPFTATVPAGIGVGYGGDNTAPTSANTTATDTPAGMGLGYAGEDSAPTATATTVAPAGMGLGYAGEDSAPPTTRTSSVAPDGSGLGYAGAEN